jgi:hypothetical protein
VVALPFLYLILSQVLKVVGAEVIKQFQLQVRAS